MIPIEFFCQSKAELRLWLESNWDSKASVWLLYFKLSSHKSDLTYPEIVDILLCFGWIDSLGRKVDDEKTMLRISPRNPKSNWSRVNKLKIEKILNTGLMHPNGLKVVNLAKQNGTWTALDDVENLILPTDLQQALERATLLTKWDAQPRSTKRGTLETLLNCKRAETRNRKIEQIKSALVLS